MDGFSFKIAKRDRKSMVRTGRIVTPHGAIETPAFVPVGTRGTVKSLTPDELKELKVPLFFVNTYHVYLRPGLEVIKKFGGLHKFMGWDCPLITDSGGFQVFSLARKKCPTQGKDTAFFGDVRQPHTVSLLVKILDEGIEFRSHWDGSKHFFTPEKSIEIQHALGADIILAFDDCTPYPVSHDQARFSLSRTHHWAVRSKTANDKLQMTNNKFKKNRQAIYGVVQGSVYEDLRKESAKFISSMDFDGIAIGGASVGESKKEMTGVLDWVCPFLPENKPRHLLGVGEIDDIFTLVEHGIDTFDCVQATRLARVGHLYIKNSKGKIPRPVRRGGQKSKVMNKDFVIDITKKEFAIDVRSISLDCSCYTCRNFSRAYLHHLFRVKELLAYRLATIHNIFFINRLVGEIRTSIKENTFLELKKKWLYNK